MVIEWDESKVVRTVELGLPVMKGDTREEGVLKRTDVAAARCLITDRP